MKRAIITFSDSKKKIVSVADNYFLRLRGLIGRELNALGGLSIMPCSQIHTCFMSYGIDVVYISRDSRVLKVEDNVLPGRFCRPVKGAHSVLELPSGRAAELDIAPGNRIYLTIL